MALDLSNFDLGDIDLQGLDVEAVVSVASVLANLIVPGAGPAIGIAASGIKAAAPVAIRLIKMIQSNDFSQEELDALHKQAAADSAIIQAALNDDPPAAS